MAYITSDSESRHIPKFGGELWFVSKGSGADTNDGKVPDRAFETIGAAITACAAGDAITIMAGTYTEDVVLNKASVELWCEIGAILDSAGTCLTVSGGYNKILGELLITPAANQIGVSIITNTSNIFEDIIVMGAASTCGFDIDTALNSLIRCRVTGIKATGKAYDIGASGNVLFDCSTAGTTTSYGFYANGTALTKGKLVNCTSVGHQTSGYYLDEISQFTILNCSSGAGDGKWRDVDSVNVWSNFVYPETKRKEITFTTTGAQTYNLFRVYGTVLINAISAHVTTTICDNLTLPKLETWDGTAAIEITDDDGGALTDLPVDSYIVKDRKVAEGLEVFDASAASVGDKWDAKEAAFSVTAKAGVATYIRFSCTSTTTPPTGALHWHVEWEPKTDNGFVEEA